MDKETRRSFMEIGRPKYILETFFNGEKYCKNALADVGTDNFLLDSGAFSYMSGAKCSKEQMLAYAEEYAEFIKQNKISQYFELDVDTIFGIDFVEDIRRQIERRTNTQSIPVWHKGRGVEYWKKMCKDYEYVAIGGLVFHVKKAEWPLIYKLVKYAADRGVKVHGLGFTKTKELYNWPFYSVDSASWTKAAARGQQCHEFNGSYIEAHRIDGKGHKISLSKLVMHNGIEWCKYQRHMDSIRWRA